jgi:hypothetical protein
MEHKSFGIILGLFMIIALGVLIFIAFFIVSLSSNACSKFEEKDEIQTCCNDWANENNISQIKCLGEWEIEKNQCSYKCGSSTPPIPTLDKDCENTPDEEINSCCNNWADENAIFKAQCIGYWELQAGWCIWQCE